MPVSALLVSLVLAAPTAAHPSGLTAQVTDVADAADDDNPFDFNASVGYTRVQRRAKITRENVLNGQSVFADELSYAEVINQLDIKAQISIYHDLELNWHLPYVFTKDASWDYRSQVGVGNS